MTSKDAADRELAHYFENPEILFWNVGDIVAGGPIKIDGYYVSPYCDWGCCRPYGPFTTTDEALDASQKRWREWDERDRAP
ncbi:MAG: hypothetical protein K2Z80_23810 [Xanthobacteraceae bacterium]|nr:hypothetical protein [Xanthobacteraceae bacterium]